MALIECKFHSHTLGMASSLQALVPEPPPDVAFVKPPVPQRYPCLYLLHGLSDDESIWQRRTSVERHAAGLPLVIVMPNGHRSFYTDMHDGLRYATFLADELPRLVEALFPVSNRPEDRFIAGLSMGGYGAFRTALSFPERYAAAASLSGALDVARLVQERATSRDEWRRVFGPAERVAGGGDDLLALAETVARCDTVPRLFQWCGTEDTLLEHNRSFHDRALAVGLKLDYSESAGDHDWACWDEQIRNVLRWLDVGAAQHNQGAT